MFLSRRSFLHFSSAALVGSSLLSTPLLAQSVTTQHHLILGAIDGPRHFVARVDLATDAAEIIELGFLAHSFLQNKTNKDRFWVVGKWTDTVAEVDFKENRIIKVLESGANSQFFGHGTLSSDGQIFYAVRYDYGTSRALLTGYDVTNYKKIHEYDISSGTPHDCHLLDDGSIMVACNPNKAIAGYPSPIFVKNSERCVLLHVDLNNGKVLNKIYTDNKMQFVAHFRVLSDGTILAVSKSHASPIACYGSALAEPKSDPSKPDCHGLVYFGHLRDKKLKEIVLPQGVRDRLADEIFGIAVDESKNTAFIANPSGRTLMRIDSKTGKYIDMIDSPARNIVFDQDSRTFFAAGGKLFYIGSDLSHTVDIPVRLINGPTDIVPKFNKSHSLLV